MPFAFLQGPAEVAVITLQEAREVLLERAADSVLPETFGKNKKVGPAAQLDVREPIAYSKPLLENKVHGEPAGAGGIQQRVIDIKQDEARQRDRLEERC